MTSTTKVTRIHARVNGTSGLPEVRARVRYQVWIPGGVPSWEERNARLSLVQKGHLRLLCEPYGNGDYMPTAAPGVFIFVDSNYAGGHPHHVEADIRRTLYLEEEAYRVMANTLDGLLDSIGYGGLLTDAEYDLSAAVVTAYNQLKRQEEE